MLRCHRFTRICLGVFPAFAISALPVSAYAGEDPMFLRVTEVAGERVALEVASWRCRPIEGEGPEIVLVGVAHIGEAELYRKLQTLLDECDLVLYESVKPAGAGRPIGDTDEARVKATLASLEFTAGCLHLYRERTEAYPTNIASLVVGLQTIDARLAQWVEEAAIDAWSNAVVYAGAEDGASFTLTSFGSDGAPGGEVAARDLVTNQSTIVSPVVLSVEGGVQAQLADMLGLEFQLSAIDYSGDAWRCSDMTLDRMQRDLAERGVDFLEFGDAFGGSGISERVGKLLVRLIKLADRLFDGMMSDVAKVMMIELLGDETIMKQALETQMGEGFADVLIGARNQVVMDDLQALLEGGTDAESIAVFYGAAHMGDFVTRFREQIGYEPVSVEWVTAIEIDLSETALKQRDVEQMRRMVRQSLRFAR